MHRIFEKLNCDVTELFFDSVLRDDRSALTFIDRLERKIAALGLTVVGIDNDMRREFFGDEASTAWNAQQLKEALGVDELETIRLTRDDVSARPEFP